jgi:hypothetical protein
MGPKSQSAENQHAKSDDILATSFGLRYDGREEWYRKAPNEWKAQIDLETRRISDLRKSIASDKKYSRLVNQVETQREKFTRTRAGLGKDTGPPRANKSNPAPSQEERKRNRIPLGRRHPSSYSRTVYPFKVLVRSAKGAVQTRQFLFMSSWMMRTTTHLRKSVRKASSATFT